MFQQDELDSDLVLNDEDLEIQPIATSKYNDSNYDSHHDSHHDSQERLLKRLAIFENP